MRTAMPLVTCWVMTAPGSSAGSTAISTPRFIGPGCITSVCGPSFAARSGVSPKRVVYSRRFGTSASFIRSCCIRRRYSTSMSPITSSRRSVTASANRSPVSGGSSVRGATTVTWAPSRRNADTVLRATRLCLTSPTMATRNPSKPPVRASAVRTVKTSSRPCVGWACHPSPALMTLAFVHPAMSCAAPLELVAHDERVDAHRGDRLDGVAQTLTLVDARLRRGERHRVGRQPLGGGLETEPGARGVLEEHVADGLAAQCRHLGVRAAVDLGHVIGEVEQADDALGPEIVDGQQRAGHPGASR